MHPLMISQKGCISANLLRSRNRGQFTSYSEWEAEADINRFTSSAIHSRLSAACAAWLQARRSRDVIW